MAQNIYDENGRKVGEIKTEREKSEEEIGNIADTIGCLAALVRGFLALIVYGPWIVGVVTVISDGEMVYLWFMIPVLVATVIMGVRIKEINIVTMWGAFWRTALVGIGAGIIGGLLMSMVYPEFADGMAIGLLAGVYFSLAPAVTVARGVKKTKKDKV